MTFMLNLTNLFYKTQNDYLKTKRYFIKVIYYAQKKTFTFVVKVFLRIKLLTNS